MGSLFRSEKMTLAQLFLQSEAAYACVSELGELGLVQFRDLNPDVAAFQKKFVNEVRRCDEMERKLRFLEGEIKKAKIPITVANDNPAAPPPRAMIDLEATFEKLENEMKDVNNNTESLKRNYLELTELQHVLTKTRTFFRDFEVRRGSQGQFDTQIAEEGGIRSDHLPGLGMLAGVISRERFTGFERMLWRVCHGNVFLRHAEIESPLEDPSTGYEIHKVVFIIFFQGEQLKSRVKRILDGCNKQNISNNTTYSHFSTGQYKKPKVLHQTQEHRLRALALAAKNITVWFIKVRKIKAIYHILNCFNLDVTRNCLIAECWCPVLDLDQIQHALTRGTERSESSVPSILHVVENIDKDHPTYNRVNKFTTAFQSIVNAYGVADYREVNPAPYTIITFPFLFGVMFGDAGHGIIMLLFAIWMCVREKKLAASSKDNEMWGTIYSGRYVILLMGLFSCYSGLIYNDVY
ncbi:V-type proton ATPase 116 kDa subunit a 1-like, partial [Saccoglossus kowalevskii]